ncbi:hypothetical protein [Streptomyces bambusae]|uniref:Uncharacterized protein n=1 Tax=Streptomyces bambusae TaxID=1550616 RepID=A0ABS6Z3X7_9ACTN|nr:hypothetical protein [Streptomyces bambusae]MBW5482473.1 hypothetical protein [Streptomyces bambusae]
MQNINEPAGTPADKRIWPRNAAWAAAAAAVTVAAFLALRPAGSADGAAAGAPAATPSATPSATASAGVPAEAAGSASPTASAAASATVAASAAPGSGRPVLALDRAFPERVPDGRGGSFTKVGAAHPKSCPAAGSVGQLLASRIAAGQGCLGHQIALYKDAANNQYNLAAFTMRDPADTASLVFGLSRAFDDYQVAAQAPPPASGLPTLPPDSGIVQSFTGQGRVMVVGLGQWSDGRTSDYQKLVEQLGPLLNAVSANYAAHETAP